MSAAAKNYRCRTSTPSSGGTHRSIDGKDDGGGRSRQQLTRPMEKNYRCKSYPPSIAAAVNKADGEKLSLQVLSPLDRGSS
jgi:hypothetical protein